MARPREFDEEMVLEAAGKAFWSHGYEATSTRDLAAVTGLTASSLYAAFGDKETLFRRALDHYLAGTLHARMQRLESGPSPAAAITGFFHEIIERSVGDREKRGCMLVNAAVEASPGDNGFRDALGDELGRIEAFFHRCLLQAQQQGEIPRLESSSDAASHLLAVLLGIRVLARIKPERKLLTAAARQTLKQLHLPPLPATKTTRPARKP